MPSVGDNNKWSLLGWKSRFQTFSFLWIQFWSYGRTRWKVWSYCAGQCYIPHS